MTTLPRTSARWYLLAFVPILLGAAVAGLLFARMYGDIEAMPRVVVPGEGDVTLSAGDHVAFLENRSVVGDVAYANPSFTVSCALFDATTRAPIKLASSSTHTTYSLGSYAGSSAFVFTTPHDGAYHVVCQGDASPGVIAFGDGIGAAIVGAIGAIFGGIGLAIFVALRVRRRRKRAHG